MTNSNNPEALARITSKTVPGLYEVSTFDNGTIIIRPRKESREGLAIDEGKAKVGTVSKARLTD